MTTTFQRVASGVHVVSRIEASGWGFNTSLVSSEEGLVVYSPTRGLGENMHLRIAELGRPRYLIAANNVHHLGLMEWKQRYPETEVFARQQAIPRLARRYQMLQFKPIEEMPVLTLASMQPDGTKDGEIWLRTNGGWIVGDAFFNVRPPVSGMFGLILRMTGTAPGLRIGIFWAPLHLKSRSRYYKWLLRELDRGPPCWLIPAHGDPISGPALGEQLRTLANTTFD